MMKCGTLPMTSTSECFSKKAMMIRNGPELFILATMQLATILISPLSRILSSNQAIVTILLRREAKVISCFTEEATQIKKATWNS